MDQQLIEYQNSISKFWTRIKGALLEPFSKLDKRILGSFLALIVYAVIEQLVYDIRFIVFTLDVSVSLISIIYSVLVLSLTLLGATGCVLMLFMKRLGWIFVLSFVMSRVVLFFTDLIWMYEQYRIMTESNSGITLTDSFNTSLIMTVIYVVISVVCLGYFLIKKVRCAYEIRNREILISFVIVVIVMVSESIIGLLIG